jgi:hypothetical protein
MKSCRQTLIDLESGQHGELGDGRVRCYRRAGKSRLRECDFARCMVQVFFVKRQLSPADLL